MAGKGIERKYGIGEWFGNLFTSITPDERKIFSDKATKSFKIANKPCLFQNESGSIICNKKSGICSIRLYEKNNEGLVATCENENGRLVTLCPNRFYQKGKIFEWAGKLLLNNSNPVILNEVDFLTSSVTEKSAGKIDNVLVSASADGTLNWCALEIQAVYFSGPSFSKEFKSIQNSKSSIPFPTITRRPDFRSSAPKRLMPQMQIKVPTLRRWGKKMAVIVDDAFFEALGKMDEVQSVSNCDIVWFVVDYDTTSNPAEIYLKRTVLTTLEHAVEGLTAGYPLSLDEFEKKLREKMVR